jgi:uncharacterized membrane protein YccC
MRIFGREPAAWLNLIGSVIALGGAYVLHLNTDQQGVLNVVAAAVVGVLVAASTHDGLSAALLGTVKALLLAGVAFHFNVSAENQALIYTLASAVLAMFIRTQVAPRGAPIDPAAALPVKVVNRI